MADQLIFFTRYPEAGRVKTRLIPALGETGAAALHRRLANHCLERLSPLWISSDMLLTVFYSGGSKQQMQDWLPKVKLVRQKGVGLGERMIKAFIQARRQGAKRILLVGSDCPDLSAAIVRQGLADLQDHDLVVGPAHDGGYYLIGISADYAPVSLWYLLTNICWGTADVLRDTLNRIRLAGNSCALLPLLHDIDRPEDLEYFDYHTCS